MQFSHIISTLILAVIFTGLWHRKNAKIHVPLMLSAFVMDVLLVLFIELNLQAVETVVDSSMQPQNKELLLFHAAVSLTVILLYVALTFIGIKLLKRQKQYLPLHKKLGSAFLVMRLINYVTSFMV